VPVVIGVSSQFAGNEGCFEEDSRNSFGELSHPHLANRKRTGA
jgi:hypothetical protein